MNGLEKAREAYDVFVLPFLDNEFPDWKDKIAVGLVGEGSDCRGFDDSFSADHDNDVGLCLWITKDTDEKIGQELRHGYSGLFRRMNRGKQENGRRGVQVIDEFYKRFIGIDHLPNTWQDWMKMPSYGLSDCTNGEVFSDPEGIFTAYRNKLLFGCPEDVRIKKIAGRLALMAQSGQYNYLRCIKHGEKTSALIAKTEFVSHAVHCIFLLNFSHTPYYKWQFREMKKLSVLSDSEPALYDILKEDNPDVASSYIESFCQKILSELQRQGLTESQSDYLEDIAKDVTKRILNPEISSLHLMECGL